MVLGPQLGLVKIFGRLSELSRALCASKDNFTKPEPIPLQLNEGLTQVNAGLGSASSEAIAFKLEELDK